MVFTPHPAGKDCATEGIRSTLSWPGLTRPSRLDHRVKPGDDKAESQPRLKVLLRLSHSSTLVPSFFMIAYCWSTERVLFQAQ